MKKEESIPNKACQTGRRGFLYARLSLPIDVSLIQSEIPVVSERKDIS
jgi:hypothetical protein